MVEMKTLTVYSTVFEIADAEARTEIEGLKSVEAIALSQNGFTSNYVKSGNMGCLYLRQYFNSAVTINAASYTHIGTLSTYNKPAYDVVAPCYAKNSNNEYVHGLSITIFTDGRILVRNETGSNISFSMIACTVSFVTNTP